jgi:DNA-binding NarL/FixJ family response regulator
MTTAHVVPIPQHVTLVLDQDAMLAFHAWLDGRGQCLVPTPGSARRPAAWTLAATAIDDAPIRLTKREFQVLVGITQGKSNSQIGRDLYLSLDTIKTHVRRLFRKLGVHDRAQAVHIAHLRGLLGGDS